jgi:hypothetical protein
MMAGPQAAGISRRLGAAFTGAVTAAILLMPGPTSGENPARQPTPIAVADLDYSDSSGEVEDQSTKHGVLLQAFVESLRRDLASTKKFRVVTLACSPEPCSIGRSDSGKLLGKARDAGALVLLYGRIHKMSTLVQWAKIQIVDVRTDTLVLDRFLTFRGDDERAWQRAEAFLAADLEQHALFDRDRDEGSATFQQREHP